MKILMLGHTGVGKTTYMASMYGTLQTQINGFSLRATNSNHHRELLRMSNDIRRSIYPDGTLHRKQYDFSLQYQGRNVFPFEWVDYRGGALVERQRDSEEARRLVSELREVEGIMLFCACDVMAKASAARQVGRMMSLVGEALR